MNTITFYITDNLRVSLFCYTIKNKILKYIPGEIVGKQVKEIKNLQ